MSDPPDPARRQRPRYRRVLKVWAGYLLLLLVLGGFIVLVDWHRRREQAGWNAVRDQLYRLKELIGTSRRPTYAQTAARFTPDRPPATRPASEGTTFRATFDGQSFGPAYDGWSVDMTFLNNPGALPATNSFMRARQAHGQLLYLAARPPRTYRSMPLPIWYHVQTGRRVAVAIAAIAWVAAAVLTTVAGAWRPAVAQVCIAAALLAGAAWLLDPAYDWSRWADDRVLKVIAGGLAIGVLWVVLPPRRRRIDRGRCHACKYDLTGNESGVCPECGTATLAFLDGRRHAESARVAEPLESGRLEYGDEPDATAEDMGDVRVGWPSDDDQGDARDGLGQSDPPPNSDTNADAKPAGLTLSAPRSP